MILHGLFGGPNLCIRALWQQGKNVLSTHAQHAGEIYRDLDITPASEGSTLNIKEPCDKCAMTGGTSEVSTSGLL